MRSVMCANELGPCYPAADSFAERSRILFRPVNSLRTRYCGLENGRDVW